MHFKYSRLRKLWFPFALKIKQLDKSNTCVHSICSGMEYCQLFLITYIALQTVDAVGSKHNNSLNVSHIFTTRLRSLTLIKTNCALQVVVIYHTQHLESRGLINKVPRTDRSWTFDNRRSNTPPSRRVRAFIFKFRQ